MRLEVTALPVDGERGLDAGERLLVPPLVPAEEAEASERVAPPDRVAQLVPEAERPHQRGLRLLEPSEQRVQVSLPQAGFRQPCRLAGWLQQGHQLVDDSLLPPAEAERLAQTLLPEEDVDQPLPPLGIVGQAEEPALGPLQQLQGFRELAEIVGARRRQPGVAHRARPPFGPAEMLHQPSEILVQASLVPRLDRLADPAVQLLPLVVEQAPQRGLLGEPVLEPVGRLGHDPDLLDDPGGLERLQRLRQAGGVRRSLEDAAGELAADHGGEPQHLARFQVQPVEAGSDHRLHGPGKPECLQGVGEDHRSIRDRELASLEERLGDLLEEKRVPAAVFVNQVHEPRRHRVDPQDGAEHRGRRFRAEGVERNCEVVVLTSPRTWGAWPAGHHH